MTPAGNIWVTDAGNQRLQEFNAKGEFIQKFGTKGTSSKGTEFLSPEGIAVAPGGMIWVSDSAGKRVAEFRETVVSESERWVRDISGTKPTEPEGIAIDASGNVLVADEEGGRVLEYGPEGVYLKTIGTAGAGNGQLSGPTDVAVAPSGNIDVVDSYDNRIEVFNVKGEYVTKFGTSGTGAAQFTEPKTIAFGAGSAIFITDKGNNRVHRWETPNAPDEIKSLEVLVDGEAVTTSSAGCTLGSCSVAKQFTLNSLENLGSHKVTVIANSLGGFSKTQTLTVNEQRDETKPTIQTGGELANAPEGWVQQESYGFTATGADRAGYGDTSLTFKIDGSQVAATTQSCPDGGCGATISKGISMASYAGGAHQAEVIATDGAGNSATKRWTINVDPDGHISTVEASATIEAAEDTGSSNLVGDSKEELEIEGTAPGLGLESTSSGFVATGSMVPTEISATGAGSTTFLIPCSEAGEAPAEGETVEVPCGSLSTETGQLVPVSVEPLEASGTVNPPNLVEENAVVIANSGVAVDTTARPLSDGGMIFENIRDESGSEEFAYRVSLSEEQELVQIDDQTVEVYLSGGFPSFTITAKPASDAIGTPVSTTLRKTGRDIVTLTVHHRAGHEGQPFVYPVVGGSGWEGGFRTVEVDMDNVSPEEEPSGTGEEGSEAFSSLGGVRVKSAAFGAPVAFLREENGSERVHRHYTFRECKVGYGPKWAPEGKPTDPLPPKERGEVIEHCHGTADNGYFYILWAESVYGTYQYLPHEWSWDPDGPNCIKWGPDQPKKEHCKETSNLKTAHLDVLGQYRFAPALFNGGSPTSDVCHQSTAIYQCGTGANILMKAS